MCEGRRTWHRRAWQRPGRGGLGASPEWQHPQLVRPESHRAEAGPRVQAGDFGIEVPSPGDLHVTAAFCTRDRPEKHDLAGSAAQCHDGAAGGDGRHLYATALGRSPAHHGRQILDIDCLHTCPRHLQGQALGLATEQRLLVAGEARRRPLLQLCAARLQCEKAGAAGKAEGQGAATHVWQRPKPQHPRKAIQGTSLVDANANSEESQGTGMTRPAACHNLVLALVVDVHDAEVNDRPQVHPGLLDGKSVPVHLCLGETEELRVAHGGAHEGPIVGQPRQRTGWRDEA
mmetsp:Transcript_9681/g.30242  ORF Transcript_9681/g.30242 Transcript_9681/m.30242 type:complete len:288 (+) Transcript_9681:1658-2521(+)